jgi:hypothetical protein
MIRGRWLWLRKIGLSFVAICLLIGLLHHGLSLLTFALGGAGVALAGWTVWTSIIGR